MRREDVITLLGEDWTAFTDQMREHLRSDIPLLENTNEKLLFNSGKQLRPMISLLVSRSCGKVNFESIRFAAATEMLHNATLFHDDVADSSSLRRGKPTLSAMVGPTAAVLIGDFWLSRAVRMIVSMPHQSPVIDLYSKTLSDLAEGEMLQMQKASDADTTEEDYLRIIYYKTASLFETACRVAAISVDAAPELQDAAGRYAAALGIAFQIRDDIFDYGQGEIGKPVGIDLKERKITLPLIGAMNSASPQRQEQIRQMVRQIPEHPEYCDELQQFARSHGGIEYATRRLDDYIEEAVSALALFPESKEKEVLAELARYNAVRNK
ncbi:MAG: polyprenyl synthetase family protein [Bacteroidales bacterium]|nr:polyprenyl synthetase family protein [Bacteroidales bacterium]MBR0290960.1 polyprenyl synthetase family protein [Bacteroidales bacterium]